MGYQGGLTDGLAHYVIVSDWRVTVVPKSLFILTYATSCYWLIRRESSFEDFILYTSIAFYSYFIFNPGVHENHSYIAVLLVAILYALNSNYASLFACIALLASANLIFFYGIQFSRVAFIDVALLLAVLNVALYAFIFRLGLSRNRASQSSTAAWDWILALSRGFG
jgi:hypothetical protein